MRLDDAESEGSVTGGDVVAVLEEIRDVTDSRRDVVAEVAKVVVGVVDGVDSVALSLVVVAEALVCGSDETDVVVLWSPPNRLPTPFPSAPRIPPSVLSDILR